jgi:hypothetical protein
MATEREKRAAARARQAIVERAQAAAARQREARAAAISNLPDIRNPRVTLRPPEQTGRGLPERKTPAGQKRQAQAFRERIAAEKLQNVGRARKEQLTTELTHSVNSDVYERNMDREQQQRFQRISERIASGSQQSLAILFEHAGGQGLYSAALERILASPTSRDVEEGLAMLEELADQANQAAVVYAPSRIGRLSI